MLCFCCDEPVSQSARQSNNTSKCANSKLSMHDRSNANPEEDRGEEGEGEAEDDEE